MGSGCTVTGEPVSSVDDLISLIIKRKTDGIIL
jgi:hypothetical protein